ncbi:hypothetical protein [Pseudomonas sp. LRF_L74]|uniref:hypothetical protein n=1 Tax=Pseudomonas sp. LRF_L74 TaxID=3369422 RepID=UPI003F5FDE44
MNTLHVAALNEQAWYLLKDDESWYLLARCSQSAVDFELLVQLSADEYREYHALGHVYLDYLAARIQHWPHDYSPRHLPQALAAANQAIAQWRSTTP